MSLKKKLIGNGIAVIFQKIIRVLEQLLLVPFFITAWGTEYYGEWLTLTIIPSILALSDFGFGSAAAGTLALKYAAGDKQGAANVGKSGFLAISFLIIVGMILSGVAMFILVQTHTLSKSLISQEEAVTSVLILIFAKLIYFYTQLYEGYFRASRRATLSINLMSLYAVLNIVGGVIVLLSKGGVIAYATSQLIVSMVFTISYSLLGKKVLEIPHNIQGVVSKEELKSIAKKGLGYLMSPIWQAIFFQGSTFAVRLTLGPGAVTIYNTVRTATRSINQLFNMIDAATFPEMQFEIGAGNFDKVRKIFRLSLYLSFILAVVGGTFLFFFGLWFYELWTKHSLTVPTSMWNLFVLGILLNGLWWTGGVVFRAYNKPYPFTIAGTVAAIISVLSTYLFSKIFDLTGAALGSLVLDIIMTLYVVPVACKMVNIPLSELLIGGIDDLKNIKNFKKKI